MDLSSADIVTDLGRLPPNWEVRCLGDVCDVKGRIGWRGYTVEDLRDDGPLVLGATQITRDNRLDFGNPTYLSREKFEESPEIKVDQWDILVVKVGNTIGKVAIVDRDIGEACINPNTVLLKRAVIEPRFLFYHLTNSYAQHFLKAHSAASAQPAINQTVLKSMLVPVPPLPEQKAIAAVLGTLDDKIELNRRMNATLEAMARALFQSWFVDFDPVRAKQEGHSPTGLDEATATLFPDRFRDSELGPIPQGWEVVTLGELCKRGGGNIQTGPFGSQLHASDYVDVGIPSIMPSDLRDNRIDTTSIARVQEEDAERLSAYRVQTGDVVYSRRGDVERRSLIRRNENGWLCGTGCLRVRFGPDGLNPIFGASHLGTAESRAWVVRHAVGATMPNLNTSILSALPIIVPPMSLQTRFAEIVGPWDERGTLALDQSRTLVTLRDTLLPKLLSGNLSLSAISQLSPI